MTAQYPRSKRMHASFKVIGWSVKHSRDSLFGSLATCGHLSQFTHYPQLNTTHVTMKMGRERLDKLEVVGRFFPKARVELDQKSSVQQAEKDLESPDVSAFIRSRSFFTEVDIYSILHVYGCIRAITFTYSNKLNHWYCKVSFYESHSLNQLLSSAKKNLRLSDGSILKIERLKKPEVSPALLPSRREVTALKLYSLFPAQETLKSTKESSVFQKSTISYFSKALQGHKKVKHPRESKSASRTPCQILPNPEVFSNKSFYIQNVISIVRSRRNESSKNNPICFVRSKSIPCKEEKADSVKVTLSSKETRSQRHSRKQQTYTFRYSELLFLEVGQDAKTSTIFPNDVTGAEATVHPKAGTSYLSQDEKSDGFTTIEQVFQPCSAPQMHRGSQGSQYSGKSSSLVLLTEYSSEAEHTLPDRYCHTSDFSNFDVLFDSRSIEVKVYPICQPINSGFQQPSELNIAFFAFPCN